MDEWRCHFKRRFDDDWRWYPRLGWHPTKWKYGSRLHHRRRWLGTSRRGWFNDRSHWRYSLRLRLQYQSHHWVQSAALRTKQHARLRDWCSRYTDQHPQRQSFHQQRHSPILESGGLIIGDGMNTRLLCWDETPQSSGQTPDQVIDIQDEVIALAEHDGTIVVAGKWDGLKIWENGTPCDGSPADKTFRSTVEMALLISAIYKVLPMTTSISISSMEMVPFTFGRTFQQKETNPNSPRELNTFEGILYSDGIPLHQWYGCVHLRKGIQTV